MPIYIKLFKSDIVSTGVGINYFVGLSKKKKKKKKGDTEKSFIIMEKSRPAVRKTNFAGLPIKIEIDKGQTKSGVDPDGKPWKHKYCVPYGEISRTEGEDGDAVDVYVGDDKNSKKAYVVHQLKMDKKYDEDKCFLGFNSAKEAKDCYFKHGPKWGFGTMDSMTLDEFKNGYLSSNRVAGFKKGFSGVKLIIER